MWIKALLAVCIVAFGTGMGYFAAGKWRARKNFYVQMCLFHERYLNELNYERKPLGTFLSAYEYTGDFGKTVRVFSEGRNVEVGFRYLTKEERAECANYFAMLGKGDALSQKSYFSAQTATLTQKRENGMKDAKARGELYVKLGLLAGLAAVILIV